MMRTTLTLEDDVAARLQQLRGSGVPMKQVINDALRAGLDQLEQAPRRRGKAFSTPTHRLGAKAPNLDNIADVLATAESESWPKS